MTPEERKHLFNTDPFIKHWGDNYAENLTKKAFNLPNVKPLIFLKNTQPYNNVPVVLVAAGPSLDKNIDILKEYQNKCIIICVDVVLSKLMEHGIKPDFVGNIDPQKEVTSGWRNLDGSWIDTHDITLFCPTTTNNYIISSWKGDIILFNPSDDPASHKGPFLKRLTQTTSGFGTIQNSFFVGATMFQFAHVFNPSAIILMGYDFSYSNNEVYCSGVIERRACYYVGYDLKKEDLDFHINFLKTEMLKSIDLYAEVDGEKIPTSNLYRFYTQVLDGLIKRYKTQTINSTEGGIFSSVPCAKASDALKFICKDDIKKKIITDMTPIFHRRKRKR